ncbi:MULTISPECIES: hypothetical protein [Nitratireductor]|uniref:hypothetical protein n=1 Tax=Nitratireductor TaxID=245876 RepID=UPI000D0D5118|nr:MULTISPECIES: hypothetical protein [Nitratireductor]PSM18855.1 hypothetical protein C7T96_08905 [Nitratireductor sp. StC3]
MANWRIFGQKRGKRHEPALAGTPSTPGPTGVRPRRKGRYSLSDAILAGLGLGIGAASFTFPWYVFFHQEQFGVRVVDFDGTEIESDLSGPFYTPRVNWAPQRLTQEEIAELPLDFAPTGTVLPDRTAPDTTGSVQPFPARKPAYALVHVAKGRAMIQDANGFWVVERGSILPDNSRVMAIEKRSGAWILRTSNDDVIEMTP